MHWMTKDERNAKLREAYSPYEKAKVQGLSFFLVLLAFCTTLSGCGGVSSAPSEDSQVSGNWQFTLTPPSDNSLVSSPLQGGFLIGKNGSITGHVQYSIGVSLQGSPITCNNGVANVTGKMSGNSVTFTAVIGTLDASGHPATQTLTLNAGSLSADGSMIQNGTYTITAGWANFNNQLVSCGTQDTGKWSASLVPPLTGGFQGFFHSTNPSPAPFPNQDFPVSGTLAQGPNIGGATATVTGTLLFQDPVTLHNDYPCMSSASLNGTISGNTVLLQVFSTGGTIVGQIGQTPGSSAPQPSIVTFDNTQAGHVLHNLMSGPNGAGYLVTTKSCSGGDYGNVCLALGSSKACSQPVSLTPFALTFPPQLVASAATPQTVTLTNNTSSQLSGLHLSLQENDSGLFYSSGGGDFNGARSFTEQDACSQNGSIALDPGGSCVITVNFAPQQSCPWLPQSSGAASIQGSPPARCPFPLTAALTVTVPGGSPDADNEFSVPLTGTGMSRIVPSVPEIDFGAEAVGEASPPQTLTFTNQSLSPVTILPPPATPCAYGVGGLQPPQPRPPIPSSGLGGIQLAETQLSNPYPILADTNVSPPTVDYFCDIDPPPSLGGSGMPNFQIADDTCSGQTLAAFGQSGDSCSLRITFVPQRATWSTITGNGLDDFVQLNTSWCGDAHNRAENNCEVDSGRFPVEIKTNLPSPLRMSPSAGMDFGFVLKGATSRSRSVTIFNDPVDPMAGAVSFTAKQNTSADYFETDNCPATLPSNQSCTVMVTFTPSVVGLDPGQITFTYNISSSTSTQIGLTQTLFLRGTGQ